MIVVFNLLTCPSPLARHITICTIKENVDEDFDENVEESKEGSQNNSSVAKIGCFLLLETLLQRKWRFASKTTLEISRLDDRVLQATMPWPP